MGLTALPLYPPIADFPLTAGAETNVKGSTPITLFMVLIAAIPSAPPRIAASAAGLMVATLGVSLAITGIFVPLLAALVNLSTSSGTCPISLPSPSSCILGQEKLSSIASAPFFSHNRDSSSHSASSLPIMDARINFVG